MANEKLSGSGLSARPLVRLSTMAVPKKSIEKRRKSFVADEARDMERWCVALTEHCALAAIDLSQRLEAGTVVSSEKFEAVPYVVDAAVGIYVREAPDVAAPRTGRGLMPGEEVEIVERVVVDDAKTALCGAVSLLCKLLLDYELAL